MSMSTHVVGFKPPDDKWRSMKAVYDACEKAGVSIPSDVEAFFDGGAPDDAGVTVDILHYAYNADMCEGVEIDLDSIPKDVKVIRFYNSY